MSVICAKCGKKAMSGIAVTMRGKNGQHYSYTRFVHYLKERKRLPKRKYCYFRVAEDPQACDLDKLASKA